MITLTDILVATDFSEPSIAMHMASVASVTAAANAPPAPIAAYYRSRP